MKNFSFLFVLISILHSSMSFSDTADLSVKKIDPDSIDPTMPFVVYNIDHKDLSIVSYRQGSPSHFNLLLCRKCKNKIYQLSPEAQLTFNQQVIVPSELALIVIKKEFNHISLMINRSTKMIDILTFNSIKKTELKQL